MSDNLPARLARQERAADRTKRHQARLIRVREFRHLLQSLTAFDCSTQLTFGRADTYVMAWAAMGRFLSQNPDFDEAVQHFAERRVAEVSASSKPDNGDRRCQDSVRRRPRPG